jgi:hypothetical protein
MPVASAALSWHMPVLPVTTPRQDLAARQAVGMIHQSALVYDFLSLRLFGTNTEP